VWISRVRVNGGFLAGLDVKLSPGLNVVIGARGVGKTTFLELIAHGFGLAHSDLAQSKRHTATVEKLLGAGEVVLDIVSDQHTSHIVVDAAGSGRRPDLASGALMLGQNELEQIASNAQSRLNLIDLRASVRVTPPNTARTSELTKDLATLRASMESLSDLTARRDLVEQDRAEVAQRERVLLSDASAQLAERREQLRAIESQSLQLTDQLTVAGDAEQALGRVADLQAQLNGELLALERFRVGVALSAVFEATLPRLTSAVSPLDRDISGLREAVDQVTHDLRSRQANLRLEAEPLRSELEEAEEGLGQITAQLRNLDAELADLDRANLELQRLQLEYAERSAERDAALDELEAWQESLFEARQSIAAAVSADLDQKVVIAVSHLADADDYRDTLATHLQGGGFQFRPMADLLARKTLPRQLLGLVESADVVGLASVTGQPQDRAARALGQLQAPDALAALSRTFLHDAVDFQLIDGSTQKSVEDLSTGQKCAVTLPIILTERDRILMLDQPEDHLDNAYLVTNVITALAARDAAQTIVATHNANIPVLGPAAKVIYLVSDGTAGSIDAVGSIDEPEIVEVVTSIMEGGRDAFQRRANFYEDHSRVSE
jgi:ABC-type cobalamin/Fe3+-siderophores transport system ATPase subunit